MSHSFHKSKPSQREFWNMQYIHEVLLGNSIMTQNYKNSFQLKDKKAW